MKVLEGKLVATKGQVCNRWCTFQRIYRFQADLRARRTRWYVTVWTRMTSRSYGFRVHLRFRLRRRSWRRAAKYDAVICLGAVIRGSTSHYDLVCNEAAKGIAQVNLQTGVPVTFGVITTENIEQAIERAGTKAGNKGADAAIAALELANLLPQI